jgi:hypothetical protein
MNINKLMFRIVEKDSCNEVRWGEANSLVPDSVVFYKGNTYELDLNNFCKWINLLAPEDCEFYSITVFASNDLTVDERIEIGEAVEASLKLLKKLDIDIRPMETAR